MAIYKLGDICEVKMCRRIFNYETNKIGGIPFYKIGTMGKEPDSFISAEKYNEILTNKWNHPKKGDSLISCSGTIGNIVEYNGVPSYFQDSNIVWLETDKLHKKYLYFWLRTNPFLATQSSTIKRLYNSNIKETRIFVPSLNEQQDIIDIIEQNKELFLKFHEIIRIDSKSNCMSDFKNLIDIIEPIELMINNIKSQIQKLRKLLLLNYEFNSSKDVISLKEITSLKANNYVGQKEYVATNAIGELSMDINKITNISKERPSRANLSVMRNSLIFSKMVGENKVWYIDEYSEKYIFSTGFFNIETKCVDFVAGFLLSNSFIQQKYNLSNGTTMVALNTRGYNDIKIRKPIDMILVNEHANNILRLVTKLQNLKNNLTNISDKMLKLLIV
jgi:restriction endonuclease S subunit